MVKFKLEKGTDITTTQLRIRKTTTHFCNFEIKGYNDRERAIGMLQSELYQTDVAREKGVHRSTIGRLWNRFNTTGSTNDRARPGESRVTTPRQDRYIRRIHKRVWTLSICNNNSRNTTWTSKSEHANDLKPIKICGTKSKASIQRTNIEC